MALLTTTTGISLSVEEIAELVVRPLKPASTALQTTTVLANRQLQDPRGITEIIYCRCAPAFSTICA